MDFLKWSFTGEHRPIVPFNGGFVQLDMDSVALLDRFCLGVTLVLLTGLAICIAFMGYNLPLMLLVAAVLMGMAYIRWRLAKYMLAHIFLETLHRLQPQATNFLQGAMDVETCTDMALLEKAMAATVLGMQLHVKFISLMYELEGLRSLNLATTLRRGVAFVRSDDMQGYVKALHQNTEALRENAPV